MAFLKGFLYSAFGIIFLKVALLIIIDPYRVFGISNFNKKNYPPNTYNLKVQHLKNNDYEGYLFGSSRANSYLTSELNKLSGLKFYNLSNGGFQLNDIQQLLTWMLKEKGENSAKEIIIVFDYDIDFIHYNKVIDTAEHLTPPDIGVFSNYEFYARYLSTSFQTMINTISVNRIRETYFSIDLSTGNYFIDQTKSDYKLEDHVNKPVKLANQVVNINWAKEWASKITDSEWRAIDISCFSESSNPKLIRAFKTFKEIDKLAKKLSHKVTYLLGPSLVEINTKLEETISFYSWLAKEIGGVWNFAGFNHHAFSKIYYFDYSHYDFFLANKVLGRMYGAKSNGFEEFGSYIDRNNVDQFLEMVTKKAFIRLNRKCP